MHNSGGAFGVSCLVRALLCYGDADSDDCPEGDMKVRRSFQGAEALRRAAGIRESAHPISTPDHDAGACMHAASTSFTEQCSCDRDTAMSL
eukprot:3730504-Pleurochrysis_carterae.AAC.2